MFKEHLPPVKAPESVWQAIEARLDQDSSSSRWGSRSFFVACLAAALAIALAYELRPRPQWDVVALQGAPSVNSRSIAGAANIREGEWLQTDGASRAQIKVGAIGTVQVEPNTRVRLTAARPNEHRLTLARGDIAASVSAPPRLFLVDTPSSTAVDLGCAYTMHVDESGSGILRVTLGSVSLEWKGRESYVPAGASCRMHPHAGPGTPYFEDSTLDLRQALDTLDDGLPTKGDALGSVLADSRPRDTLTLWHLLSRIEPQDRTRVLDRILALEPSLAVAPPREELLNLNRKKLELLKEQLGRLWR
jgi:hypothetical protein